VQRAGGSDTYSPDRTHVGIDNASRSVSGNGLIDDMMIAAVLSERHRVLSLSRAMLRLTL
jgi:hypothetical protein